MSYTLVSSERSPFGRICRLFMIAHKIPFEFKILNFVDDPKDAQALAKLTPINKIPILIIDGLPLFESRVIINYLSYKHGVPPLRLEDENIVSCVYSCMDVMVQFFLMKRSGYDLHSDTMYMKRQAARIPSNLEFVMPWADQRFLENPQHWNFATMSLFCFIDWAERRAEMLETKRYPGLQNFRERFSTAPGVKETSF